MNTNNVVSAPGAANLAGKEARVVKMTSTGINLTTATADKIVGTLLRAAPTQESGVYAGKAVGVQLARGSVHYATIGNSSAAVGQGDTLALDIDPDNPGKLVPSGSNVIAIAWHAFTASDGLIVEVVFV